jgi:hypothetical protein
LLRARMASGEALEEPGLLAIMEAFGLEAIINSR